MGNLRVNKVLVKLSEWYKITVITILYDLWNCIKIISTNKAVKTFFKIKITFGTSSL